jgi:hypothetical protein
MKTRRQLTVGSIRKNHQKVPYIRLTGYWLARNGFQIGRSIVVRVRPGGIDLALDTPENEPPQPIEGFLIMHHQGHYAICNRELFYELRQNDCVAVELEKDAWVTMTVMRDMEGYYLKSKEISFYPKMVYGRLVPAEEDGAGRDDPKASR